MILSIRRFLIINACLTVILALAFLLETNHYCIAVFVVLTLFLLSEISVFWVITRALGTLNKIVYEVSHREPEELESVEISSVPQEIKPLVGELNQLLYRLKQGFEREKRFAADAAHELRTPLAALKTQAQVALKAEDPETRQQALQHVVEGVDRSTHLIQQLLTLSRLVVQSDVALEKHRLSLYKMAATVVAQLAPAAVDKSIEIELSPETDTDGKMFVQGNDKILNTLMMNLVDNAIRYTHSGGQVIVSVESIDDHVIFKVTDNGPGVPEEFRSRLFERFFRMLGNDTTGNGLGLVIVEQAARLHNAEINISECPPHGGFEISIIFKRSVI